MEITINAPRDNLYINTSDNVGDDQERYISYSIIEGNENNDTTIFFSHGAGGNKNQWRYQWRHLAGSGHRLVAWDNLGHGASARSRSRQAYAGDALLTDASRIFDTFRTKRNILVAHSYGTRLTLGLLARLREAGRLDQVAGVLLLGVPPMRAPLSLAPAWLPTFVLEWMRPRLTAQFRAVAWHPAADPALVEAEEKATLGNSMFMLRSLLNQAYRPDMDSLAKLALPIDIVAGEDDRLTPVLFTEQLAQALPDARLHLALRSGHQIMLEQPVLVDGLLDEIIGRR